MYTKEQFAKLIDYTLIRPTTTRDDVLHFCSEARKHHFAAAVVLPSWVPLAVRQLDGSDVKVCTTIGFPHGASTRSTKVYEARNAITNGAEELDIVINVGALKSGDYDFVRRELSDVVSASQISGLTTDQRRILVKVIIETPLLDREEKITACHLVLESGADYVKTATGTAPGGSSLEDIHLIRTVVGPTIGVKAAGGIRTVEHAMNLLDAGVNRLGTSSGVVICDAYDPDELLKAARQPG